MESRPGTSKGVGKRREGPIRRGAGLGIALAAVTTIALSAPALGETAGNETIDAVFLVSGQTGHREVVASAVIARGTYNAVGRIVEIESQPGDPEDLNRDDLVFPDGTVHLLSVAESFSLSLDPASCTYRFHIQETSTLAGGTGRFTNASGTASSDVSGQGLADRHSDGSCDTDHVPLWEADRARISGTLAL